MKEQVTLQSLALTVEQGFNRVEKQFEDLAALVNKGFDEAEKLSAGRFQASDQRFVAIGERLDRMELRLDQAAYRFELVELTQRVQRIEGKIGLTG